MFDRFRRDDSSIFDRPIERVLTEMEEYGPTDPEWETLVERLSELHKQKAEYANKRRVSPDTVFTSVATLAGIVIIVGYEHAHPVTSKAMSLIRMK